MHPDLEQLQRLAHRELDPAFLTSLESHLAGCAACRDRLAALEREEEEVHALLVSLDHPVPRLNAAAVMSGPRTPLAATFRWAAGILLALGAAGAAWAAPGSPLPGWLDAVLGEGEDAVRPSPTLAPPPPASAGGVAVDPQGRLAIVFRSLQASGQATVRLTEDAEVQVRASGGAPTFTAEDGRLLVDQQGPSGDFEILVPTGAPRVEVWVGDRRVLLAEGGRVTSDLAEDPTGAWIVPLGSGP